ncbi:MAG: phosphatidylglycerol lysyltransferase domain-containing protein [Methanomicrobiales archaeon]|jgi:hypothetical protein|nr:phosphatidylglycerol lysyltransferase domain-containing protein [Methanomicrobiales archaeon]
MLSGNDFHPVTLGERPRFIAHYLRYPQVHSDNTFTNMVCWNHYAHYAYAEKNGSILISSTIGGKTAFRPPIGVHDDETLYDLLSLAVLDGDETPLTLIDLDAFDWIHQVYPDLPLHPDRDHFEYLYSSKDLSDLSGRNYLSIRRQINRFMKNCTPQVEVMTPEHLSEVRAFLVEWCEWKNCEGETFLSAEKDATFFAIDHYGELRLSGQIIRVHDKIGAMALYEPLNATTAVVHFEKGLPDCEGIYKAINAETARVLHSSFPLINRESDMGHPGLREAKTRYHPVGFTEVYSARREDIEKVL